MKRYMKGFCIFLIILYSSKVSADWEIINTHPRLVNLETMGDTWFAY